MRTTKSLLVKKTRRDKKHFIKNSVNILIATLAVVSFNGCSNETQPNSLQSNLSDKKHDQLVLETKHAILNLDVTLLKSNIAQINVNRLLPDKSSLLSWAVETQEPEFVRLILDKGAAVQTQNANRFSPIIQACRYGNSDIINALLDQGADPNSAIEDGTSAFQLCAGTASTKDLAKMVKQGANFAATNDYGQTALMWSANYAKVDNLQYLLSIGANINQQTNEGYNALFFAIKSRDLNAVKATISQGADLLATAKDGTTAAQLGVYTKNNEFLTWLASEMDSLMSLDERKEVLTAFDRNGHQLLHAAVIANQPSLVSTLLALGANSDTVSQSSTLRWRYEANFKTQEYLPPKLSPIEIARQQDFTEIMSMLAQ